MILGIDFGSSATDYVLMDKRKIISSGSFFSDKIGVRDILRILEKYDIEKINVTGGKAGRLPDKIDKIKVKKVDEIDAIGKGGCFVSKSKNALIVSIGSGTAMVSVKGKKIRHIGGTPVGARTLVGLGELLLGLEDVSKIERMALRGKLDKVDLTLKEIYPKGIGLLPPSATASHFGNIKNYTKEDIAKGLINMVAQTVGSVAVFGAKGEKHRKIILTGKIAQLKSFREVIVKRINNIMKSNVVIPENSGLATAIGAALS